MSKHPANVQTYDQASFGDRLADKVSSVMGSWRFIIVQTVFVALWIALNTFGFVHHWDVYPFILLNLMFSTQAAYAAPILQLASNRQSAHDRARAEADFETNQLALAGIKNILLLMEGQVSDHEGH